MNRAPSSTLLGLPTFAWKLLLAAAIVAVFFATQARAQTADCALTTLRTPPAPPACPPAVDSWIFMPSRFTHDPATGARVAQYAMKPPIEPLNDPRPISSGYYRSRLIQRGADGSVDTTYRVTSYGNGRGGMDAEWERFHDAWRGSTVAGGQSQAFVPGGGWGGGGWNGGGWGGGGNWGGGGWNGGGPGYGIPPWANRGYGYGPGYGVPDAGRLDPDGADGYREPQYRTPNREFYYDKPARDFGHGGHHGGGGGHHND